MFNSQLPIMIGASLMYGATSAIVASTGFLYLLELIPKKNETRVATLFWLFD